MHHFTWGKSGTNRQTAIVIDVGNEMAATTAGEAAALNQPTAGLSMVLAMAWVTVVAKAAVIDQPGGCLVLAMAGLTVGVVVHKPGVGQVLAVAGWVAAAGAVLFLRVVANAGRDWGLTTADLNIMAASGIGEWGRQVIVDLQASGCGEGWGIGPMIHFQASGRGEGRGLGL